MRHSGGLAVVIGFSVALVGAAQAQSTDSPSRTTRPAQPKSGPSKSADPIKTERERDIAKASEPMRFTRVRSASADCGSTCPEWIAAEGRIMPGVTAAQLRRLLASIGDKKLPIFIHSAGGAVEEAYAIGRLIRAKGLAVSVTKTDIIDCAAADKDCRALSAKGIRLGNPKAPLSVCASSCVFILAGGVQRHVGPLSLIGVHQYESSVTQVQVLQKYRMVPHPRTGEMVKEVISEERVSQKTIKTKTRDEVYDKSETFFKEMGVSAAIMTPLRATPHSSMHWLSPSEVSDTKIATDRKVATLVLGLAPSASVPTAPRPTCDGPTLLCQTSGVRPGTGLASTGINVPDPSLGRALQAQLKAGNCLAGDIGPGWGMRAQRAIAAFSEATGTKLDAANPTEPMLATVRSAVAARDKVCKTPVD